MSTYSILFKLASKTILTLITLFLFNVQANQSFLDEYFANKLSHLNEQLIEKKDSLKSDHDKLKIFVDKEILPLWDSATTLKALLGTKEWNKISLKKQNQLLASFNQTLHRYVREGMKFYENQKLSFVSTKLSKKGDRGILAINIEPEYLPTITVTFKMTKIDKNWKLYDVMLQGISYVKMKRLEFRRLNSENGIDAVIKYLNKKN